MNATFETTPETTYTPEHIAQIVYGPLEEAGTITTGLDYYKPTMSQLAYEQQPDAQVSFTFKNRGEQRLMDCINFSDLQDRLDAIQARGWQESELGYLGGLQNSAGEAVFAPDYLDYLRTHELPRCNVGYEPATKDLYAQTSGDWPMVTFWETVLMSEVNELYFEGYVRRHGLNVLDVYDEGERRLAAKIDILREHPEIKFADFGTRRHFSLRWQEYVVERLLSDVPDNFVGTSNVGLAKKYGIKPIGTFAHEMPMVYAGLADAAGGSDEDIRDSHQVFLNDWFNRYGVDLSTGLTDTFKSAFFFSDFTPEQAQNWKGVRHDSGDPVEFGERLIKFYEDNGIDAKTKTVVFSDGLDINDIVTLQAHFGDRINVLFGWGTTLTNDLGIKPLNVVMKATQVNGVDNVKLSDNVGKHTGPEAQVQRYERIFDSVVQLVLFGKRGLEARRAAA
ncbi:MAG: nicotinate phosphoribosyltransferase, nicotinate phosphoribosyltransferase [Candidatus Saccharibacteria bacterium]|nr:nicotinate phosphoribosyltransferase, nicotinate phosphoribosyltransferase [Candidatus Saccharibacteria bacterium]